MKNIFIGVISLAFLIFINGCSHNTNPEFRIKNGQSNMVAMKIQTSEGNKFNINDIEPGQTTAYQTVSEGNITATAVVQNESISFIATRNTHYTIIISNGNPPSLQVDQ